MSVHQRSTGLLLLLSVALALAAGAAADGEIPKECQDTGVNLQSACSADIQRVSSAFGVSPGDSAASKVSQAQVDAYLNDPANKVTSPCCAAAISFNAARCNCNANVLALAASFIGGDTGVYDKVTSSLAKSCGFGRIC